MSQLRFYLGVIGSGKDYRADQYIKSQDSKVIKINFADALKEEAWQILGWAPSSEDEYEEFKSIVIVDIGRNRLTGREFLQNLGEYRRSQNINYWAKLWQGKVGDALMWGTSVVCSDLRHANELKIALELCVKYGIDLDDSFVFCNYESDKYNNTDTHISERLAQKLLKLDYNDGSSVPKERLHDLRSQFEGDNDD